MKLSLYCGLRAIAYVINNGQHVVKYGIKRVNIPFDNYYEFIAGLPVSKRINRRMKRQARRNLWRFKSRRNQLRQYLSKTLGCSPQHLTRTDNLKLRVKGLSEELTPQELVNVLCQLQNKRGYKSLRGVSDNENSEYLKEIERHEENRKQYSHIAEYLLSLESNRDIIFLRQSYEDEFNTIMDEQAQHNIVDTHFGGSHPAFTDFRNRVFRIIYHQNPLRKGKISKCDYERNREATHASHPMYQEFRILRDIQNIKIYDANKNEVEIPDNIRKVWFEKCNLGSNLTKASCLKDLGIKNSKAYSWFSGNAIPGNPIVKTFRELNISNEHVNYVELWQDLFSAVDNDRLGKLLCIKYEFNDYTITELLDLDLTKLGYADFSMKAIRKLTPLMHDGKKLKDAILEVYGKVDFKNVALRNVVLEQHFYSYKALLEHLQKEFPFEEIQFELDPLLKAGNKQRKSMAQAKRKDEKFHKEHPQLSSYDLMKLKLWHESEGVSPYEPDYLIPLEELFTDRYNIDHIVPKSKIYERGYGNSVLCRVELNEKKGRMTGLDFAKSLGIEQRYREVVAKFPDNKQQFLLMSEQDIPHNWISRRQNSDYNTRCFATVGNATNIPNKLLTRYLGQWCEVKYDEQDARYYLNKAWVMANMSQETVAYFDKLKEYAVGHSSVSLYGIQPELEKMDIERAPVFMPRVKFVRKTAHGYTPRFGLHGETVFGKRERKYRNAKGQVVSEFYFKVRQPIAKLTPAMVEKIMDTAIKYKINARIAEKGSHEAGIASLVEHPAMHNGKPIKRISISQSAEKIFPLHSTSGNGKTERKANHARQIDYVFSDKNRFLNVWKDENGKIKRSTITLMEFVDMLNGGNLNTDTKGVYLAENDVIELRGRHYFIIGASDALALRPVHTLSATETYKVKADDWMQMQKVIMNQVGDIKTKYPLI